MIKGKLLTTIDINQKFQIGELKGNEVWALESNRQGKDNRQLGDAGHNSQESRTLHGKQLSQKSQPAVYIEDAQPLTTEGIKKIIENQDREFEKPTVCHCGQLKDIAHDCDEEGGCKINCDERGEA